MDGGMNPTLATRCRRRLRQTYWRTFPPGPFWVDDAPPTALAALGALDLAAQNAWAQEDKPKGAGPRAEQPTADLSKAVASVTLGSCLDGPCLDGAGLDGLNLDRFTLESMGDGRPLAGSALAAPKADHPSTGGPKTQAAVDGDGLISSGDPPVGVPGLELALTMPSAALPQGERFPSSPPGGLDVRTFAGAVLSRESSGPALVVADEPVSSDFEGGLHLQGAHSWNGTEQQPPAPWQARAVEPGLPLSPAAQPQPDPVPGPAQPLFRPDWLGTLLWLALTGLDGWLAFIELVQPMSAGLVRLDRLPIRSLAGVRFQPLGRLRWRQPLGS